MHIWIKWTHLEEVMKFLMMSKIIFMSYCEPEVFIFMKKSKTHLKLKIRISSQLMNHKLCAVSKCIFLAFFRNDKEKMPLKK